MTLSRPLGVGLVLVLVALAVLVFTLRGTPQGAGALPAIVADQPLGCNSCNARHQHLRRLAAANDAAANDAATKKELAP
jgi:hypothetical protein